MDNLENSFNDLYGNDEETLTYQKKRFNRLSEKYSELYSKNDNIEYFSAPGRTELSGNHTDHNGGRVIAASVNLDTIACVSRQENYIDIISEGFDGGIHIDLNELNALENEKETSSALVRGVAAAFGNNGYKTGGFKGVISSDVLVGSGLSSSASFEVLIGTIINHFYNNDEVPASLIARFGQFAENNYFGKPCGLMDQVACAVGSVVTINFNNREEPEIGKINFDLGKHNYKLLVVDTGGSHHNLTEDYAAIPEEMKNVAEYFGEENCSDVDFRLFREKLPRLYCDLSHRALLRSFHFFKENERVTAQVKALKNDDFDEFLTLVNKSGNSSFKYLQNVFSPADINEQPLSVALAITEDFISAKGKGACRVHGGGFAGTILVFLHDDDVTGYKKMIEPVFGKNSVSILTIRNTGATVV